MKAEEEGGSVLGRFEVSGGWSGEGGRLVPSILALLGDDGEEWSDGSDGEREPEVGWRKKSQEKERRSFV